MPFLSAAVLLCLIFSCSEIEETPDSSDWVEVSFVPSVDVASKSSLNLDERTIGEFSVFVFRDGRLEYRGRSEGAAGTLDVRLLRNVPYDIYALANFGDIIEDADEAVFIDGVRAFWGGLQDTGSLIPMAYSEVGAVFRREEAYPIGFERLVSRIGFSVDTDVLLDGLEVESVRLCNAALAVRPFAEGGSRALSEDEVSDGDYASERDLLSLNSGREVVFYSLENARGRLLEGNTDEWLKTPDSLGSEADLCTYLEVECRLPDTFALEGKVTYRFYPGEDNSSDFSLIRNHNYSINLFATNDGFKRLSWRISSDAAYRPGLAEGLLEDGNHPLDGMYVGEIVRYKAVLSSGLSAFLGDESGDCTLEYDGDELMFDNLEYSDGVLYADAHCLAPDSGGRITLRTPGGPIVLNDDVTILVPELVFSRSPESYPLSVVVPVSSLELKVNDLLSETEEVYVYLTDSGGYNLNSSYSYGFDMSLFNLSSSKVANYGSLPVTASIADTLRDLAEVEDISVSEAPDRPVCGYRFSAANEGSDPDTNRNLGYAVSSSSPFSFSVEDLSFGSSASLSYKYEIEPITLSFYEPSGISIQLDGFHNVIGVRNPSNISTDILFFRHARRMSSYTHTNGTLATTSRVKIISAGGSCLDFQYAASDYAPDMDEFFYKQYGSYALLSHDPSSPGSEPCFLEVSSEGEYFYVLDKINSASYLEDYVLSDPAGTGLWWNSCAVCSDFDISSEGINLAENGRVRFVTALQGEPFNVSSRDVPIRSDMSFTSLFPGSTPCKLYDMVKDSPLKLKIGYDNDENKFYITCANNVNNLSIDLSFTIEVDGRAVCYPNGTKRDYVINDLTTTYPRTEVTGITPSLMRTYFDNGRARYLMDLIYTSVYEDNSTSYGSNSGAFYHSAHPMRGRMRLDIKSSDGAYLVPFTITVLDGDFRPRYYHPQDNETYIVDMDITCPISYEFGLLN